VLVLSSNVVRFKNPISDKLTNPRFFFILSLNFCFPDVLEDVSDISDGDIPDIPEKEMDDIEPEVTKPGKVFKKILWHRSKCCNPNN